MIRTILLLLSIIFSLNGSDEIYYKNCRYDNQNYAVGFVTNFVCYGNPFNYTLMLALDMCCKNDARGCKYVDTTLTHIMGKAEVSRNYKASCESFMSHIIVSYFVKGSYSTFKIPIPPQAVACDNEYRQTYYFPRMDICNVRYNNDGSAYFLSRR
uniref:ZP domain-containing protein n=1 Tax=Parastrongyloides trichosuri TaxID=131310 RepID=A0A0N4Z8H6_PARTI